MHFVYKYELDENPMDELNIREYGGFEQLWYNNTENSENIYKDINDRLTNGDIVYSLYFFNDVPILKGKIHRLLNNKEFEEYKESNEDTVLKALEAPKGYENPSLVWFEKDNQLVHPSIVDYLSPIVKDGIDNEIYELDKSGYESFLKAKGIVYQKLSYDLEVNKKEIMGNLFIQESTIEKMLSSMRYKKNIILQGPPGVGKSYIARKLAYLTMQYRDPNRVQMIQFHQSYSYEDFIQGYKPEASGGFKLKNGTFYNFCKIAQADPTQDYFFIIDEINRGNLSKIFGELMLLIEADKRGEEFAIPLTYSEKGETFYIPENLYLIGLMNTADRSLAVVDYALRRRFAFINMEPVFEGKFLALLKEKKIPKKLAEFISTKITDLNDVIENDYNLGRGFFIGHSYFCSKIDSVNPITWYNQIIENEIGPMLEEYWHDEPLKAVEETEKLFYKGK